MNKNCTYFITEPESINQSEFKKVDFTVIGDDEPMPVRFLGLTVSIKKRVEPLRNGELLYDKSGQSVAIKSNGKILPIIEGDL